MRMADQRGMRRIRLAFIQQGLQLPDRPVKEERFDSGWPSFSRASSRPEGPSRKNDLIPAVTLFFYQRTHVFLKSRA
jgi:hypothetical protein